MHVKLLKSSEHPNGVDIFNTFDISSCIRQVIYHLDTSNLYLSVYQDEPPFVSFILSGTEFNAFIASCKESKKEEVVQLALQLEDAYSTVKPQPLFYNEWHLPYEFLSSFSSEEELIRNLGSVDLPYNEAAKQLIEEKSHMLQHIAMVVDNEKDVSLPATWDGFDYKLSGVRSFLPKNLTKFVSSEYHSSDLIYTRKSAGFYTLYDLIQDNYCND